MPQLDNKTGSNPAAVPNSFILTNRQGGGIEPHYYVRHRFRCHLLAPASGVEPEFMVLETNQLPKRTGMLEGAGAPSMY